MYVIHSTGILDISIFRKGLDASNVCLVVFLLAYNAADILSALIFESGEETNNSWKWFFTTCQ